MTQGVQEAKAAETKTKEESISEMNIPALQIAAEGWKPQQILDWAFHTFGDDVAISSAFGAEGMVLIDMASRLRKKFRLFTLDTEFLFPETYNLMDQVEQKYGIGIERVYSLLTPEKQDEIHRHRAVEARFRSMLQPAQGRTSAPQAERFASLDHQYPPRPDCGPLRRWKNPLG